MPMTTQQKIAGGLFLAALASFAFGAHGMGGFLLLCWLYAGLDC